LYFPPGRAGDKAIRSHWDSIKNAASKSGFHKQAVSFVLETTSYARKHVSLDGAHVGARLFCHAFRDYARLRFGGEERAIGALAGMGIRRSEDVGRIVFALVDAKRIMAAPEDSLEQFAGLFTVENLFNAEL
jgi:uncharacterized repeat protein (TIGR04138 family)